MTSRTAQGRGRSLLVTGGAGFIGTNFLRYWRREHAADRLVVLDALTYAGNLPNVTDLLESRALTLVKGDICDAGLVREVLREHATDTIVHFAAESHVDRSIASPDEFIRTNVVGTHTLLAAARAHWAAHTELASNARFHHISTDEVFGSLGPDDPPFTEASRYEPNSPYAASKASSDHLARAYHRTYALPVVGSNCSNNFGPYQYPEKLLPLMITNALAGRSLPVYGDGMNVRDWLYVEDHCRAIDAVLTRGNVGDFYNVGGNNEWANLPLVRLLCQVIDEKFAAQPALRERFANAPAARSGRTEDLIRFVTDRPGHDRRYAVDGRRMESELGFAPSGDFRGALGRTVQWYLDNEDWWRAVMSRSAAH